ncbi:extensin-like [Triticum aestivum]|uniref:extensin-like n=1 Tax=Triticum aestivum TaxID=4565 RepID=UPI001D01E420|nr:extensin-like [Triticum aestivum]XP_044360593.1 extensin-like [Triticum aestivum]
MSILASSTLPPWFSRPQSSAAAALIAFRAGPLRRRHLALLPRLHLATATWRHPSGQRRRSSLPRPLPVRHLSSPRLPAARPAQARGEPAKPIGARALRRRLVPSVSRSEAPPPDLTSASAPLPLYLVASPPPASTAPVPSPSRTPQEPPSPEFPRRCPVASCAGSGRNGSGATGSGRPQRPSTFLPLRCPRRRASTPPPLPSWCGHGRRTTPQPATWASWPIPAFGPPPPDPAQHQIWPKASLVSTHMLSCAPCALLVLAPARVVQFRPV